MLNRILSKLRKLLPGRKSFEQQSVRTAADEYAQRLANERANFAECEEVHDLPPIFHYWSNKYLLPMFEPFGFTNPLDFFLHEIRKQCRAHPDRDVSIVSIGAGNCDSEIYVGKKLLKEGLGNFGFDCIEINRDMIKRGKRLANKAGLSGHFSFMGEDFNTWRPGADEIDVVMANQSLHHVVELEYLFESIRIGMRESGVFVTSDMIGRNGHMRWPEALERVQAYWQELPDSYRRNHLMKRVEQKYINHDCSTEGFEGIRAQDILPLLARNFNFSLFLPFGNIVMVFIDRTFGHNFDAGGEWDRAFIDRLHEEDERSFIEGSIKPTSMLAAMTLGPTETRLRDARLTPDFCIRDPNA